MKKGESQNEARKGGGWLRLVLVMALLLFLLGAAAVALRTFSESDAARAVPIADVSSERLLALGSVVGFAAAYDTHAWLGIPFASPPVASLRWRAARRRTRADL